MNSTVQASRWRHVQPTDWCAFARTPSWYLPLRCPTMAKTYSECPCLINCVCVCVCVFARARACFCVRFFTGQMRKNMLTKVKFPFISHVHVHPLIRVGLLSSDTCIVPTPRKTAWHGLRPSNMLYTTLTLGVACLATPFISKIADITLSLSLSLSLSSLSLSLSLSCLIEINKLTNLTIPHND